MNLYPATTYPAQTPYNTRRNQLHDDQRSPDCLAFPRHSANRTHTSLTLGCKYYKILTPLMGRGSARPTIKQRKSSRFIRLLHKAQHQTRKCLRDLLCHPPRSHQTRFSRCPSRTPHLPDSPNHTATATAKSLQSCPTLCDPIDGYRQPNTNKVMKMYTFEISGKGATTLNPNQGER